MSAELVAAMDRKLSQLLGEVSPVHPAHVMTQFPSTLVLLDSKRPRACPDGIWPPLPSISLDHHQVAAWTWHHEWRRNRCEYMKLLVGLRAMHLAQHHIAI